MNMPSKINKSKARQNVILEINSSPQNDRHDGESLRKILADLYEAIGEQIDLDACGNRLGSALNAASAVLALNRNTEHRD